jgi:hypothetical protein
MVPRNNKKKNPPKARNEGGSGQQLQEEYAKLWDWHVLSEAYKSNLNNGLRSIQAAVDRHQRENTAPGKGDTVKDMMIKFFEKYPQKEKKRIEKSREKRCREEDEESGT